MARHSDAAAAGTSTTLGELARLVGGRLDGEADRTVVGIAGLDEARHDEISFCALATYRTAMARTTAAAVVVAEDFEPPEGTGTGLALIRVENPYLAVAAIVDHFFPRRGPAPGVHASAVIAPTATIGEGVSVGAGVVVGDDCVIGDGCELGAGCVIADGVHIGADCRVKANVTIYPSVRLGDRVTVHAGAVLGADGFGYAAEEGHRVKIRQVGGVIIEDEVEIGANACVDRAAMGVTRIRRGTKIDNLVQIGHNCDVGPDSILCGQVGVSGSTTIGKGVLIGGQAGLGGHLTVGDGAMIAGGSGVTGSVPAGAKVGGYPHLEASRWRRVVAALRTLPELARRVRRLEARNAHSEEEED